MTTPTATPEQLMRAVAERYEQWFVPTIGEPVARRVVEAAGIRPDERVLDLACGTGIAGRLAAETTDRVVGVDANPAMIAIAEEAAPELDWRVADAADLPLDPSSFDVVVCSQGLQFFGDRAAALAEVERVLAPGGRAVFATPGPTPPLLEAVDAALAVRVGPEAAGFVDLVFSLHDADVVAGLLVDAGFDEPDTDEGPVTLHVGPPAEFFAQFASCSPLALFVGGLDDTERQALADDVVERCAGIDDPELLRPNILVATARKPVGG